MKAVRCEADHIEGGVCLRLLPSSGICPGAYAHGVSRRELIPLTFADELRAAATELRTQAEGGFHPDLANWLDHTAALIEGNKGRFQDTQSSGMALLTARAINGGAL